MLRDWSMGKIPVLDQSASSEIVLSQRNSNETGFPREHRLSNIGSSYTKRLMSLDAFRGATMASMVLVNNGYGPSTFSSFRHAEWNGWTFADLVFPFFLWIVGVSMTFSFARRIEENADRYMLLLHTLQRATLLFGLGLLLNGFPDYNWEMIRIPGVLQRIAVCYLIGAVIFMYTSWRGQICWIIGLFVVYSMMMTLIPVPGYGAGVLTPTENFVQYIDNLLLSGHLSRSEPTDSLGVVSTLPAIANVLCGVLCGQLLRREGLAAHEKTIWMFVAAVALMLLAWFLDHWMPINKKLWTPPYALLTSGLAFLGFACCYWFIDVLKKKGWANHW